MNILFIFLLHNCKIMQQFLYTIVRLKTYTDAQKIQIRV